MDANLYREVMEWKRRRPPEAWKTPRDTKSWFRPQGYTQPEVCLRGDMAANRAAWTGDVRRDLWLWTRNTNPIVAMCYSHPLHPITRLERYYILLLQILLFGYIAITLTHINSCETYFSAHGDCDEVDFAVEHAEALIGNRASMYCCELSTQALTHVHRALTPAENRWWAGAFSIYLPLIGLTAAVTLLNVVLGQLWFLLAGCPCFQRSPRRHWWEFLGSMVLLLFGIIPFAHIWWLLTFFEGKYLITAYRFLVVKLIAVSGSTLVQTAAFAVLWRAEMYANRGERLFVSVHDTRAYLLAASATAAGAPHADITVEVKGVCL